MTYIFQALTLLDYLLAIDDINALVCVLQTTTCHIIDFGLRIFIYYFTNSCLKKSFLHSSIF